MTDPRLVSARPVDDDLGFDQSLRPRNLDEYVGQAQIIANLRVAIEAARSLGEALDHVLLFGPPGVGKTSLAHVIAAEMGVSIKATAGPIIERAGDLAVPGLVIGPNVDTVDVPRQPADGRRSGEGAAAADAVHVEIEVDTRWARQLERLGKVVGEENVVLGDPDAIPLLAVLAVRHYVGPDVAGHGSQEARAGRADRVVVADEPLVDAAVAVLVRAVPGAGLHGRAGAVGADEGTPGAGARALEAQVAVGAVAGGADLRILGAVRAGRVAVVVVSNLPIIIQQAEDRILKSVQLPDFRKNSTGLTTNGDQYLGIPTDFLAPYSLAVNNSGYEFLIFKEVNFIREAYPVATVKGVPKYYAIFEDTFFLLGPTPNAAYEVELHYFYKPTSIVTASTSWLGTHAESALFNVCMHEAYVFLKGDPDLMAKYKEQAGFRLAGPEDFGRRP